MDLIVTNQARVIQLQEQPYRTRILAEGEWVEHKLFGIGQVKRLRDNGDVFAIFKTWCIVADWFSTEKLTRVVPA